jgi:hypothetical protein
MAGGRIHFFQRGANVKKLSEEKADQRQRPEATGQREAQRDCFRVRVWIAPKNVAHSHERQNTADENQDDTQRGQIPGAIPQPVGFKFLLRIYNDGGRHWSDDYFLVAAGALNLHSQSIAWRFDGLATVAAFKMDRRGLRIGFGFDRLSLRRRKIRRGGRRKVVMAILTTEHFRNVVKHRVAAFRTLHFFHTFRLGLNFMAADN